MNLFILSLIQREIAQYMMDKHLHKIILEAVQMLCSAKRILSPDDVINDSLYKLAHKNHPVTIWCRTSKANFLWVLELVEEMHNEWRYRYDHHATKMHKSYLVAQMILANLPEDSAFPEIGLTSFALAIPDKYKLLDDPVLSYRNYYMSEEKQKIACWKKKREKPDWYLVLPPPTPTPIVNIAEMA